MRAVFNARTLINPVASFEFELDDHSVALLTNRLQQGPQPVWSTH